MKGEETMKNAQLFYIPSNGSHMYHGYYAVAENEKQALKVFQECWKSVVDDVDKKRNVTLKDLILVDKEIALPNGQVIPRILNTYLGLVDIKMINYFDKPVFFGWDWKVGPEESTGEIMLSSEALWVYQYDYDARGCIEFQADDYESGLKVIVDGRSVIWMYTYETDTIYNEVRKNSTEEAISFALSIIRDAKILRKKYEAML